MSDKQRAYSKLIEARGQVNAAEKAISDAARVLMLALDDLAECTDEYIRLTESPDHVPG